MTEYGSAEQPYCQQNGVASRVGVWRNENSLREKHTNVLLIK